MKWGGYEDEKRRRIMLDTDIQTAGSRGLTVKLAIGILCLGGIKALNEAKLLQSLPKKF
jgi:hypothetical protein